MTRWFVVSDSWFVTEDLESPEKRPLGLLDEFPDTVVVEARATQGPRLYFEGWSGSSPSLNVQPNA